MKGKQGAGPHGAARVREELVDLKRDFLFWRDELRTQFEIYQKMIDGKMDRVQGDFAHLEKRFNEIRRGEGR